MKLLISPSLKTKLSKPNCTLLKYVAMSTGTTYTAVEFINKLSNDLNKKYSEFNLPTLSDISELETIDEFNKNNDQALIKKDFMAYVIDDDNNRYADVLIANADKLGGNTFITQQLSGWLLLQLEQIPNYFSSNIKKIIYSANTLKTRPDTVNIKLKCLKVLGYDLMTIDDPNLGDTVEPYTSPQEVLSDYQKGRRDQNKSSGLTFDDKSNSYTLKIAGAIGSNAFYYDLILLTIHKLSAPKLKLDIEDMKDKNMNRVAKYFNSLTAETEPPQSNDNDREKRDIPTGNGKNEIHYGAPGTGKSYSVNQTYPDGKRITFYPTFDYTDFVGGLKPVRTEKGIDYQFVGGALANIIIDALNNPDDTVTLIIEELNRAEAASVFGDTFQLLDRLEDTNVSRYAINNIALAKYIDQHTKYDYDLLDKGIKLPGNLNLIATMNPADQGVFVLDSAFKRRWRMTYHSIDWSKASNEIVAGFEMTWPELGKRINQILLSLGTNEDSLLGQFFFTNDELRNQDYVGSKLLGYLWNDVARYKRSSLFIPQTFSDLINTFNQNKGATAIFRSEVWNANHEIN